MKQFALETQGGLCNRLRAFLSAIGRCEARGQELLVCWPVLTQDWCPFHCPLSMLWRHDYTEITREEFRELQCEKIATGDQLECPRNPAHYLNRLTLINELQRRLEAEAARFSEPEMLVGVNIRVTRAHQKSLECSPVEWFVEHCRTMPSETAFFLSVDSREASRTFHEAFPGRVIECRKEGAFNSLHGVQEAVVDLYLLARTDRVVGSYYSSFSTMAGWMQGEGCETQQRLLGEIQRNRRR